jgi:hypothetical protein
MHAYASALSLRQKALMRTAAAVRVFLISEHCIQFKREPATALKKMLPVVMKLQAVTTTTRPGDTLRYESADIAI